MATRTWVILILLMTAETVSGFETSMILAGLPSWMRIFGDPVAVGWIVTSYLLVAASASAICGRLGDIFGRKRVLVAVIAITALGSTVSAMGHDINWIIVGRGIQGMAGAILPLCYGLAREYFPAEKVPFSVGLLVAITAIAAAVGFLIGGILTGHYGPQSIFVASAILGAVVLPMLAFGLPPSTPATIHGPMDWLGGILFAPGVALLLLLLGKVGQWGWHAPASLLCLFGGLGLLLVWVFHELRQRNPLIDVRLLASRNCLTANLVMAFAALGVMQLTQLTSLLLQQPAADGVGLGVSATLAGIVNFPALATGIVSSIWAGWASARVGGRFPTVLGCAVMAMGTGIAVINHASVGMLVLVICLGYMGVTVVYAGVPNILIAVSPADRTSEATGLMTVIRAISQAIGAQLLAIILASSTTRVGGLGGGKMLPNEIAYMEAYGAMTMLSLIALALTISLPRRIGAHPGRTETIDTLTAISS